MFTYSLQKHELKFKVPAKTSRNTFTTRTIFLITLNDIQIGKQGIGEASPLSLLSLDDVPNYQLILEKKLDGWRPPYSRAPRTGGAGTGIAPPPRTEMFARFGVNIRMRDEHTAYPWGL